MPAMDDEDGPGEALVDEVSPTDEDTGAPEDEEDCPDETELPDGPLDDEGP